MYVAAAKRLALAGARKMMESAMAIAREGAQLARIMQAIGLEK